MGAHDYLRKPIEPDELLMQVKKALEQRKLKIERDVIKGRFNFISGPVKEILGYENRQFVGKHYTDIVHPEDWEKAENTFNERRRAIRGPRYAELRLKFDSDNLTSSCLIDCW